MNKLFAASLVAIFASCSGSDPSSEATPASPHQATFKIHRLYPDPIYNKTRYTMKMGELPALTAETVAPFEGRDGQTHFLTCKDIDNKTVINNNRLDSADLQPQEFSRILKENTEYALGFDKMECKRLEV